MSLAVICEPIRRVGGPGGDDPGARREADCAHPAKSGASEMQHELATLTNAELDLVSAGQFTALAVAFANAYAYGDDAYTESYTETYTLVDEDEAYAWVYARAYASAG
jgi:hypothetical protein